jgi:hypothetical protein
VPYQFLALSTPAEQSEHHPKGIAASLFYGWSRRRRAYQASAPFIGCISQLLLLRARRQIDCVQQDTVRTQSVVDSNKSQLDVSTTNTRLD